MLVKFLKKSKSETPGCQVLTGIWCRARSTRPICVHATLPMAVDLAQTRIWECLIWMIYDHKGQHFQQAKVMKERAF